MRKYITYDELNVATGAFYYAVHNNKNKYAEGLTLDDFLSLTLAFVRAACGPKDYREIAEHEDRAHEDGDALGDIDAGVDDVLDYLREED